MIRISRPLLFAASLSLALAATAAFAAVSEVDQVGQRFSRGTIAISAGDIVHFVNHDDVRHNIHVTSPDGTDVDKGFQDPGQVIEVRLDSQGRFIAHCMIHQKMKLNIDVR